MKHFICIISIGLLLSSCNTYYYSTIHRASYPQEDRPETGYNAVKEKVEIAYYFQGNNGDVIIEVINTSDQPVYVDWKRSALIADNVANEYAGNNAVVYGSTNTSTYFYATTDDNAGYASSESSFSGNIVLPKSTSFIPPGSKIVHVPISLSKVQNLNLPKEIYRKGKYKGKKMRYVQFTQYNTPLRFRSYITLYSDTDKTHFAVEDNFFLSGIMHTKLKPRSVHNLIDEGNTYYYRVSKGYGLKTASIFLGPLALIAIASIVSP